MTVYAEANPEKRLFISLLTRDISLVAALLDLLDNSINSALEPYASRLKNASDYAAFSTDDSIQPSVDIKLSFNADSIEISDNAQGISAVAAEKTIFNFGRPENTTASDRDRLSVYGIGLKRAMFKAGNLIEIVSDHREGGFSMTLNVKEWSTIDIFPWRFEITPRPPAAANSTGTRITIAELTDETTRRLSDGVLEGQLRDAISRTYSFFLEKIVTVSVNGEDISGDPIDISENRASESFELEGVSCSINAGIGQSAGGRFRDRASGWFVYCNGRAVIGADKSPLTGWGGFGLPLFQPKHRPFLGTVFFVATDPEKLPWTTTKSGINEDSLVWQHARRLMANVARSVISFLDARYTDDGVEGSAEDIREASASRMSFVAAAAAAKQSFQPPTRVAPTMIRIQYDAQVSDLDKIRSHLKRPGMGGAEIGRYTFQHFLRNQVGK